jgi:hypothetical protein
MTDQSVDPAPWVAVRCVVRLRHPSTPTFLYEERITLWQDGSVDSAIERAEREASSYAKDVDGEYIGLAQAFALFESPRDGQEVFSLMRESTLESDEYLNRFFDTGNERTSLSEDR